MPFPYHRSSSKKQISPSTRRGISNGRQEPSGQTTTFVTTLNNRTNNNSPATYFNKDHLLAPPSIESLPPAAPLPTGTTGNNNNPDAAPPIRFFFSASLERSLLSSGKKRKPRVLSSSSSWTAGHLTRGSDDTPASSLSRTGGRGVTDGTTNKKTIASTPPTTTAQLQKKGQIAHSTSAISTGDRGEEKSTPQKAPTTRHTDLNKTKRRWKVSRANRPASSSGGLRVAGGNSTTTLIKTIIDKKRSESPEGPRRCRGKVRPSVAVPKGQEPAAEKEEGIPVTRVHSVATTKRQQRQQQQQGEHQDTSHSSSVIGVCSGRSGLPMVKCWEGTAFVKEGSGVAGGGGSGDEGQRPRGRPARSRSHLDCNTGAQPAGDAKKIPIAMADSSKPRNRMEAGSAGVSAVGRDGGGLGFGRETSDGRRFRHNGRGGGGVRAMRGGTSTGGSGGGFAASMVLDDHPQKQVANASSSSATTPPLLQQLAASPSAEDAVCCDFEDSLSVCSSLPPMGGTGTAGTATVATDLIFEESSFEDSAASLSQASSTERNGNDTLVVGGGSGANGEGTGGTSGQGKRGGAGATSRQRSGSTFNEFVRTRYERGRRGPGIRRAFG